MSSPVGRGGHSRGRAAPYPRATPPDRLVSSQK